MLKLALFIVAAFLAVNWLKDFYNGPPPQIANREPVINEEGLELFRRLQNPDVDHVTQHAREERKEIKKGKIEKIGIERPKVPVQQTNKYDLEFLEDLAKQDPHLGSNGSGAKLSGKELKEVEEIMKKEAFNILMSDRMPYNRYLASKIGHPTRYLMLLFFPSSTDRSLMCEILAARQSATRKTSPEPVS